jgi:MOSC domain-containing protein YiiM
MAHRREVRSPSLRRKSSTRWGCHRGETRRQLTVRGVRLNELIGKRFRVGEVECYGVALCEPCKHLEQLTRPGIIEDLIHRAGINADILTDGQISVGDKIVAMNPA